MIKDDYHDRCQKDVEAIISRNDDHDRLDLQSSIAVLDQDDAGPDEGDLDVDIGSFSSCKHHYNGLFSTIWKCRNQSAAKDIPQLFNPDSDTLAIKQTVPSRDQPPHDSVREARILSRLLHENVIRLIETEKVSSANELLLVFPFYRLTLADVLDSDVRLPYDGKHIICDVFRALAFLHYRHDDQQSDVDQIKGDQALEGKDKGTKDAHAYVIHRDIKPSNILLRSENGRAVLADFGIAWSSTDKASEAADQKIFEIGTTAYRAPELLFGDRTYDVGVDLWAAGCVVAEIVMHNVRLKESDSSAKPLRSKQSWTLFDPGNLGSELALIHSIFKTLGTPNEQTWPESNRLPDWGKIGFVSYPSKSWSDILPGADEQAQNLLANLVKYESAQRWRAPQVMEHPFLREIGPA